MKKKSRCNDLRNGIVRILDPKSGNTLGTGFFVDRAGLVVTCNHVISEAQNSKRAISVYVNATNRAYDFRVVRTNSKFDLAILETKFTGSDCEVIESFRLCKHDEFMGVTCETFGYPIGKATDGTPGRIEILAPTTEEGINVIGFRSSEVTEGFSGAPVWHKETDCVVGVIMSVLPPDKLGRGGENAYFIPSQTIRYIHEPLHITNILAESWFNWIESELAFRAPVSIEENTPLIDSPLLFKWHQLINSQPWNQIIESQLSKCIDKCHTFISYNSETFRPIRDLLEQLQLIDCSQHYHIIKTRIEKIFRSHPREVVNNIRRKQHYSGVWNELKLLNKELWQLEQKIQLPFEVCFLVLGNVGEGKSHLLWSLVLNSYQEFLRQKKITDLFLFLPLRSFRRGSAPMTDVILAEICRVTNLSWKSLDQFLKTVNDVLPDSRLVIAIDDFDLWIDSRQEYLQEIVDLVTDFTDSHNVFWFITMNYARYPLVSEHDDIWFHYGSGMTLGWHLIDEENQRSKLGLRMIEAFWQQVEPVGNAILSLELIESKDDVVRHLCSPFVATVVIDLKLKPELLVDLRFVDFVKLFLERLLRELNLYLSPLSSQSIAEKDAMDFVRNAIYGISRLLANTGNFSPDLECLIEEVYSIGQWPNQYAVKQSFEVLHNGSLIQIVHSNEKESYFDVAPKLKNVKINYGMVWECLVSNRLLDDKLKHLKSVEDVILKLSEWMTSVTLKTHMEGVLEYLILRVEKEKFALPVIWKALEEMMKTGLAEGGSAASALLMAAPRASREYRRSLIDGIYGKLQLNTQVFGAVYFVTETPSSEIDLANRVRFIQPYYAKIGSQGLGKYLLFMVNRHMEAESDNAVITRTLPKFFGCEAAGVARFLAELTVRKLVTNAGLSKPLLDTYNENTFLREALEQLLFITIHYLEGYNEEMVAQENEHPVEGRDWEHQLFRSWFLTDLLHEMVSRFGIETYGLLDEMEWFVPNGHNICTPIKVEMAKSAHFALADFYRREASSSQRDAYVKLVLKLAKSEDENDIETAFFLINHTVPTYRHKNVKVDDVFHLALRTILQSGKPEWLLRKYAKMFQVNLKLSKG